ALVLDDLAGGELAVAEAAEEIDFARIVRAGDEVELAVPIEVHELWTGADTSVNGDLGINAAGLKVDGLGVTRLFIGSQVLLEAEIAAEIAPNEVQDPVAVYIRHPRSAVAP